MQAASEKYDLNMDFWGKYQDIPSMALASEKSDILQIIENFALIRRKHVYLFQRLKITVLRSLEEWSATDFAGLCHAWAQLGFLHEDLLVAMSSRVVSTAQVCSAQELVWLMDAYATARCSVESVNEEIIKQTILRMDEFTLPQLCHHASSFARLNMRNQGLFLAISSRFEAEAAEAAAAAATASSAALESVSETASKAREHELSAHDLTLAAYSFAKLGFHSPGIFEFFARRALEVVRDFTARDLQMLTVALVRARHADPNLLEGISIQAQRRIAQFSSESLVLMLRSMAYFGPSRPTMEPLFTRAIAQLPRAILSFRPADMTVLLGAFAAVQVHSTALFDVVTPAILEKAPIMTPTDWICALRSYSALGRKDDLFLSALSVHLEASKLSFQQLSSAMVACSRLSYSGLLQAISAAAVDIVAARGTSPIASPAADSGDAGESTSAARALWSDRAIAESATQMYAAVLLLGGCGGNGGDSAGRRLLSELSAWLREESSRGLLPGALAQSTCASLCFATLLAAPSAAGAAGHPVDALILAEHCAQRSAEGRGAGHGEGEADSVEVRPLLRQVRRALRLLPLNRRAAETEAKLDALLDLSDPSEEVDAASSSLSAPYVLTALRHLVPHCDDSIWQLQAEQPSGRGGATPGGLAHGAAPAARRLPAQGIFVAQEIRDALEELSAALTAGGVDAHRLVLDDPDAEAHIAVPRAALLAATGASLGAGGGATEVAVVWGSTAHYISAGAAQSDSPLSPTAQFEIAYLKAVRGVDVVVVPNWWWWPTRLRSSAGAPVTEEERGRALVRRLLQLAA